MQVYHAFSFSIWPPVAANVLYCLVHAIDGLGGGYRRNTPTCVSNMLEHALSVRTSPARSIRTLSVVANKRSTGEKVKMDGRKIDVVLTHSVPGAVPAGEVTGGEDAAGGVKIFTA